MAKAIDAIVLILFGRGTAAATGDVVRVLSIGLAFGFAVFLAVRRWALHLLSP